MKNIEELLNKAGKFYFDLKSDGHIDELSGNLRKDNTRYELYIDCNIEFFRRISKLRGRGINVKGIIEGTEVTLYNSYVRKTAFVLRLATRMESYSATICPDKIVIGISSLTGIQVKEIEATLLPLNRFFVEVPVLFEGPIKDDPTFLKYNQSKNLKAEDGLKEIECVNDISVKHSVNEFIVQFEPLDRCIFEGNIRCQVVLNFSDPSDNQTSLFVISSSVIADNFETIWDRCINFYHKSHNVFNKNNASITLPKLAGVLNVMVRTIESAVK